MYTCIYLPRTVYMCASATGAAIRQGMFGNCWYNQKLDRSSRYDETWKIPRINPAERDGEKLGNFQVLLSHAFPFTSNKKQFNFLLMKETREKAIAFILSRYSGASKILTCVRVKCIFCEKWIECVLWMCITFAILASANFDIDIDIDVGTCTWHSHEIHVSIVY